MSTVMSPNGWFVAVKKISFCSLTYNVIHPNPTSPLTEIRRGFRNGVFSVKRKLFHCYLLVIWVSQWEVNILVFLMSVTFTYRIRKQTLNKRLTLKIPAWSRRQTRPCYPMSHHKEYPTHCYNKSPLFPPSEKFHPSIVC